jgi:hypothetical protein
VTIATSWFPLARLRIIPSILLLFMDAAAAQTWTAFRPEGGRCRIDLPGTPTVGTALLS